MLPSEHEHVQHAELELWKSRKASFFATQRPLPSASMQMNLFAICITPVPLRSIKTLFIEIYTFGRRVHETDQRKQNWKKYCSDLSWRQRSKSGEENSISVQQRRRWSIFSPLLFFFPPLHNVVGEIHWLHSFHFVKNIFSVHELISNAENPARCIAARD